MEMNKMKKSMEEQLALMKSETAAQISSAEDNADIKIKQIRADALANIRVAQAENRRDTNVHRKIVVDLARRSDIQIKTSRRERDQAVEEVIDKYKKKLEDAYAAWDVAITCALAAE